MVWSKIEEGGICLVVWSKIEEGGICLAVWSKDRRWWNMFGGLV